MNDQSALGIMASHTWKKGHSARLHWSQGRLQQKLEIKTQNNSHKQNKFHTRYETETVTSIDEGKNFPAINSEIVANTRQGVPQVFTNKILKMSHKTRSH